MVTTFTYHKNNIKIAADCYKRNRCYVKIVKYTAPVDFIRW